ncbi:MAG: hypothetical protein LBG18_02015 [Mediterranea sp.]|jgi:hypothetical protein|nr:hypothetical protein [Mediterranea sp.]
MKGQIKLFLKSVAITAILPVIAYSCHTQRPVMMTEHLFMQYKRVNITYPADRANEMGGATLSEQVTYSTHQEVTQEADGIGDTTRLDTNKVYNLSGVTVASKIRFTSVREGHVNINFVIHVPKELISHDFRMQLMPELMYRDTTVMLEHVVLLGRNFIEKQKQDYQNYDAYLGTIIPEEDYDKAFLDKQGIRGDMRLRQELYWGLYTKERDRVIDYWKWRDKTQARYNFFNSRREMRYRNLYHNYQREGNWAAIVKMTQKQDTVGTSEAYLKKFKRRVKRDPYFKINREIVAKSVPRKYRDLFFSGTRQTEVQNYAVTELDSIEIAGHRYFFDDIVMNEMKDSLRNQVFQQEVPYTYLENVKYSITLNEPQDFTYLYSQEYPVEPGMKALRIHLKGRIDAIDNSGYTLPQTDTLSYLISSLEELADSTLLQQNAVDLAYREGFELLVNRDYPGAIKALGDYNDYNMALSLACQGYNQQAYALLKRLPQNVLTLYLNAIVSSRLDHKMEAVTSLEKACELDTSMIYRCMRDEEIKKLIADFDLQERLDEIEFKSMN